MSTSQLTHTEFGEVSVRDHGVTITADISQLYSWAHRPGAHWPCSQLEDLDSIKAHFDAHGLVDLIQSPEDVDIPSDEFTAWSSDVLRDTLSEDHPVHYVSVGQFA